jgi:hypothetical protein
MLFWATAVVYYPDITMMFWTLAVVYYPGIIMMFWTETVAYSTVSVQNNIIIQLK